MIWAGIELMGDIPFSAVNYHSMILAPDGRRMSKSLGTGIDPTDLIEQYGADATRYGLLKMSSSQDVRFSHGAIEEGRKLANKLWNVSRLLLSQAEGIQPDRRARDVEEHWILARLHETRAQMDPAIPAFEFAAVVDRLYHLTFDDFCDWYAEAVKPRLYAGDEDARATALYALQYLLKLLHPVMPHVTEEIWSQFHDDRLMTAPWPVEDGVALTSAHELGQRPGGGADASGGAAFGSSSRETRCGSSRQSSSRSARRSTGTSMSSERGSTRRSTGSSACSTTRDSRQGAA